MLVVANWTPVPRPAFRIGAPREARWKDVLDTDDARFGGSGYRKVAESPDVVDAESVGWQGRPTSIVVDVPPLSMLWLVEVST